MAKKFWQLDANDTLAEPSDLGIGIVNIEAETSVHGSITVGGKTYVATEIPFSVAVRKGTYVSVDYGGYPDVASVYKNGIEQANHVDIGYIDEGDYWKIFFSSCLHPDTIILMADSPEKKICDVRVGDAVMTPFGPDVVTRVGRGHGESTDVWTFDDGTVVKTIGRHRFFNVELGEPMYLEAWNMGESAFKHDWSEPRLVSHERVEGTQEHATIFTKRWNLYFANGLLAGNRMSRGYRELKKCQNT